MTKPIDPSSIDLAALANVARERCGHTVPGEVVGKTRVRDQLVAHLTCSELEAEQLVDTMIARGFMRRLKQPDELVVWEI